MHIQRCDRRKIVGAAILVILGLGYAGCSDGAAVTMEVPALTVHDSGQGSVIIVSISVHRDASSDEPLTISVTEDSAGGGGEALRASLWQACTVAALERRDDLSGVRVEVKISGQVDGPSAGGIMAVALMSALDERPLPPDCAFTGSIMPDGTIGRVGGLPAKLKAAADAGFKRVIVPAYVRFEPDPVTGKEVDLKRLAQSLGMEYLPVSSLNDAYRAMHKLTEPPVAAADESVLELDTKLEEWLKTRYTAHLAEGDRLYAAIPQDERAQLESDSFFRLMFLRYRSKAEVAFRSGKLLAARSNAQAWSLFMRARTQNVKAFQNIRARTHDDWVKAVDAQIGQVMSQLPSLPQLIAAADKGVAISGSQFLPEMNDTYGAGGIMLLLETRAIKARHAAGQSSSDQEEVRQSVVDGKVIQLLMAFAMKDTVAQDMAGLAGRAQLNHAVDLTGNPARVERLFNQVHQATFNTFDKGTVPAVATANGISIDEAKAAMFQADMSLVMYGAASQNASDLHQSLGMANSTNSPFALAAGAQIHASCYTTMAGIITRWEELDVEINDDGSIRYHRSDLLNHLIRTARVNALSTIAQCRQHGIPCVVPIQNFELADLARDDNDEDKVDVLTLYWQASIQAKALLMLFGSR